MMMQQYYLPDNIRILHYKEVYILVFDNRADLYDDDAIQQIMKYDLPWCYMSENKDIIGRTLITKSYGLLYTNFFFACNICLLQLNLQMKKNRK